MFTSILHTDLYTTQPFSTQRFAPLFFAQTYNTLHTTTKGETVWNMTKGDSPLGPLWWNTEDAWRPRSHKLLSHVKLFVLLRIKPKRKIQVKLSG